MAKKMRFSRLYSFENGLEIRKNRPETSRNRERRKSFFPHLVPSPSWRLLDPGVASRRRGRKKFSRATPKKNISFFFFKLFQILWKLDWPTIVLNNNFSNPFICIYVYIVHLYIYIYLCKVFLVSSRVKKSCSLLYIEIYFVTWKSSFYHWLNLVTWYFPQHP